jgi:hypothetical protein
MSKVFRLFLIAAVTYFLAWLAVFFFVAGTEFSLIPSYFLQGWSFSGGELPTFIWLFSWPCFIVAVIAIYLAKRRISSGANKL